MLPVLEIRSEGQYFKGTLEIAQFLSEELDLNGDSDFEQEQTEVLMDYMSKYHDRKFEFFKILFRARSIEGSFGILFKFVSEIDAICEIDEKDDREMVITYFLEEFLPQFLETLEILLEASGTNYLCGDKV